MADGINQLKAYWLRGEGAAKIRWGTDGDYTRCVRQLDKHVGESRARRICAQWHMDANGIWPGHHGGENKQGPG
ncbi:hypothetical protein [Streptomonospora litoralis]|uniref:Uncharacterized protein n=1 Tax=Streptomonospora litoralis TaxID=2498135 RepID=A0A4P6Q059_9ACTN|nr:hypothetical protein [Streptomonospora litoralis]QBI53440.1 hypothetical protein EKD16_08230 [Streptomonospora litoralis]